MRLIDNLKRIKRDFNCAPHPGNNDKTYDSNSKLCPFLKPGDKWYLIAAGSFCGVVIFVLVIIGVRTFLKRRAVERMMAEPNPANERATMSPMRDPLMLGAADPGRADSDEGMMYDEKDGLYGYSSNPSDPYVYQSHQDQYNQSSLPYHSSDDNHNPYGGNPYPMDPSVDQHQSSSSHSHGSFYPADPMGLPPTERDIYSTPEQYLSPESEPDHYHLQTPNGYPDPGMTRTNTGVYSNPSSGGGGGDGFISGRTSIVPQVNGSLPSFPPPVSRASHHSSGSVDRDLPTSPVGRMRSPPKTPISQKRWYARYGKTPPVPDRPAGLQRYASGIEDEDGDMSHMPMLDEEGYMYSPSQQRLLGGGGGSSEDHSRYSGSEQFHTIPSEPLSHHSQQSYNPNDSFLYEVPTINENEDPFRARRNFYR